MEISEITVKNIPNLNYSIPNQTILEKEYPLWEILSGTMGYIYLKKTSDMSYIDCNDKMLNLFFKEDAPEKQDKLNIMKKNPVQCPTLSAFIETVEELEKQVIKDKIPLKDVITEPFLNMMGKVIQLSITLYPLLNPSKNKVNAILFYGEDVTPQKNHGGLLITYKHLYKNEKLALSKFLEHIGFSEYIVKNKKITIREFEILLKFSYGKTAKEIANTLNISARTVEIHLNNIKEKLNAQNKIQVMRKFLLCYKS